MVHINWKMRAGLFISLAMGILFFGTLTAQAAAPAFVSAKYQDLNNDGAIDTIRITFNQTIAFCTIADVTEFSFVAKGSFTSAAFAGGSGTCSGTDVILTLGTPGNANTTGSAVTPTISYAFAANVIQNAGNEDAANFTAQNVADNAKPIVTAVDFKTNTISGLAYNAIQVTYSEAMNVSTTNNGVQGIAAGASGTSVTTMGAMTTARTLAGIGTWNGTGDMTTSIDGSNTVSLDGTGKILTVSFNAVNAAGSYFNAGSIAPTTPTFTPTASVLNIADLASTPNAVNTATKTATNTIAWDVTKPTLTSVTINDAAGNNGKIDQATVVFSEAIRDNSITDADALLGGGGHTGTFTTGTANDATTVFNLTTDNLAVDTSASAAKLNYTGATTKIRDIAGNLVSTTTPGTIVDADTTSIDGAKPIITGVDFKKNTVGGLSYNAIAITYSEPVVVSTTHDGVSGVTNNGAGVASVAALGAMTTARTLAGIGTWNGGSDMTTFIAGSNTVALTGGNVVTVSFNSINLAGSYFNAGTTAPTTPVFTPTGSAVDVADAAGNVVNTAATPTATNSVAWDVTKPTLTSVTINDAAGNNGKIDQATVVFSEAIRDNSITDGDARLGGGSNTGTFTTGTANDSTTTFNLTADTLPADTSATGADFTYSGATTKVRDIAGNLLVSTATNGTIATADAVEIDGAKPVLLSAVRGISGGKNRVVFTYSEPMFVDLNQDGLFSGGEGANLSTVSSASIGGISVAGTINKFGSFATAGTLTQDAQLDNTVSIDATGKIVTVTLNTLSGSYFNQTSSAVEPSGNFTPATADWVLAQAPASIVLQRVNTSGLAPNSGAFDVIPPAQTSPLSIQGSGATSVNLQWSPPADPGDFQRYDVYYRQSVSGTNFSNGTLWNTVSDPSLATLGTSATRVTGLNTGFNYYFVVYGVDTKGNLSTVSNEANVLTSSTSGGTVDTTAPAAPTGVTAVVNANHKVVLTWTDPTATDLQDIKILRGKNGVPVSGAFYATILKGVKTYTDPDTNVGDMVQYMLRASDTSNNLSTLTPSVAVSVLDTPTPPAPAVTPPAPSTPTPGAPTVTPPTTTPPVLNQDQKLTNLESKLSKLEVRLEKMKKMKRKLQIKLLTRQAASLKMQITKLQKEMGK